MNIFRRLFGQRALPAVPPAKSPKETDENLQEKGKRLYRSGQYQEALYCFHKILAKDQGNILAYLWASDCYREMRDYDKALETVERGLREDPQDARFPDDGLFKTQGQLFLEKGDIVTAIRSFQEAIRRHRLADVVPFNYLRAVYDSLGLKEESDFVFRLKQHMRPLTLTEKAEAQVKRLCAACQRDSLQGMLWSIGDLQSMFTTQGNCKDIS